MISMQRTRRGFTLVEMLVVIVIITALAAIILPAVFIAIGRAKQSRIVLEVSNLARALERYKMEYGEYPPDFSAAWDPSGMAMDLDVLKNIIDDHLRTHFRRRPTNRPNLPFYDYPPDSELAKLDPSTALVFWLRGFTANAQYPITGGPNGTTARNPFMDFDKGRFVSVLGTDPTEFELAAGVVRYFASGDSTRQPYLYYNSDTYALDLNLTKQDPRDDIPAVRWAHGVGAEPPYLSRLNIVNDAFYGISFAEPEKLQIISSGLDGVFGPANVVDGIPTQFAGFPIIEIPQTISKEHKDNITSFSGGTIADMPEG